MNNQPQKPNKKGQIIYIVAVLIGFVLSCILFAIARNEHGTTQTVLNNLGLFAFLFTPGLWFIAAIFNALRGK
ncbi:MAG: hypothetical protein RLZZ175_2754 [Bacteroidota bacterium]|jgi:hypothetical protein